MSLVSPLCIGRRLWLRGSSGLLTFLGQLSLIVLPDLALGQSMDYGAFEQLFGEPVTTSAIGTPQRARDVPADVEIVTADDIRRSGAVDIPGVLAHVVGMDVQRWTNLGADVAVRGYNSPFSPRMLVLVDGRQVYNDTYGFTEWAALPVELSEIRQIEIVKGPNSALFGFNATAGVVNIITFNPLYDKVNTATIKGGTLDYLEGSAVGTVQISKDVAVRLTAGGTRTDDYRSVEALANLAGLPQQTRREEFSADVHWRINQNSEVEFQASHGQDQRLTQTPVWTLGYLRNNLDSVLGRYIGDTPLGVITASVYSNWSYAKARFAFDPTTSYGNQLTVATVQDVFKPAASQTVRVSAEYRHSSLNTAPVERGEIAYNIGSLGAMWNGEVLPALSLTAAIRADTLWLQRTGEVLPGSGLTNDQWARRNFAPSYNFGAVWRIDDFDWLRVAIARGVQLPSLLEFGGVQNFSGYVALVGNPAIKPASIDNYEISWDHNFPSITTQARVAAFYEQTREIPTISSQLDIRPTPAGYLLVLTDNIGNSEEVGAEFSLKGSFADSWRWKLSYTPRFVHDIFVGGASYQNTGVDFEHTTPRHVVDGSLGWSHGKWEVDGFVRWQSSSDGLFVQNQQTYSLVPLGATVNLDGRIAYRMFEHATISLTGQNVLFSSARQTSLGKVQQRILGGVTVSF